MTKARLRLLAILMILLTANATYITLVVQKRAANQLPDPLEGHPHYEKVKAKIKEIKEKSFDQLVASMSDAWVTRNSGVNLASIVRGQDFSYTLANRNTRRLLVELRAREETQRHGLCREIFSRHFAKHKDQLERVLTALANGTAEATDEPLENHLAICNSVFLTAACSNTDELASQLRQLIELRHSVVGRLKQIKGAPPGVYSLLPKNVCPDDEFVISMLWLNAGDKSHEPEGPQSRITAIISGLLEKSQIRKEQMISVPWDAKIDWHDLVFFKQHVEFDQTNAVCYDALYWGDCNEDQRETVMTNLMSTLP